MSGELAGSPERAKSAGGVRRAAIAALCAVAIIAIWLIPSHIARLVADHDPVLLGRYSVEKFAVNVAITGVLVSVGLAALRTRPVSRQGWFKMITAVVTTIVCIVLIDGVWRMVRPVRYVETEVTARDNWPRTEGAGVLRRRPPGIRYTITYIDEPEQARSYPRTPPGFPPQEITLTIDASGYRNASDPDDCDIITIGDSFTEGSRVSDEDMWPVLLSERSGHSVYNLGISGTSPDTYLASLLTHGLSRSPEVVIVMLYEGNDLRAGEGLDFKPSRDRAEVETSGNEVDLNRSEPRFSLDAYIDASPLIAAAERALVRLLGRIGADSGFRDAEVFDWLPIPIDSPAGTCHYAFKPDRLTGLLWDAERFSATSGWAETEAALRALRDSCNEAGAQLVICYAPSKARVVLPLARGKLPEDHVRTFASYEERDGLPPSGSFLDTLFARLDGKERVVRVWCAERDVPFVSFTEPLRVQLAAGVQAYYTYDQHWTHLGHDVVADVLVRFLRERDLLPENE